MDDVDTSSHAYPYKGMTLTPALILKLTEGFLDAPMPRPEIIRRVTEIHRAGGGAFASDAHLLAAVKKGLSTGVERGQFVRPRSGWYVKGQPRDAVVATPELMNPDTPVITAPGFDRIVGDGDGEVYVWFYDAYQQLAQLRGEERWSCKIGRSETGAGMRIREQTGYAPEQPHYALLIRTDHPQPLESHLHGFLASRGRRLTNAIGSEWFTTNPDEVLALAVDTIWVTSSDVDEAA